MELEGWFKESALSSIQLIFLFAQTEFNFICEYLPCTSPTTWPSIPIEPNVDEVRNEYGIKINTSDVLKDPNYDVKIMFLMVNGQTVFIFILKLIKLPICTAETAIEMVPKKYMTNKMPHSTLRTFGALAPSMEPIRWPLLIILIIKSQSNFGIKIPIGKNFDFFLVNAFKNHKSSEESDNL